MKVKIGDWSRSRPFYDFFEKIGLSNETNHKIHDFLASLKLIERERVIKVRIDGWDSYDACGTLPHIIIPVLQDLRDRKQGIPLSMYPEGYDHMQREDESDEEYAIRERKAQAEGEKKWTETLDKMIFAFESHRNKDWEEQFWIVHPEIDWTPQEPDENGLYPLKWKVEGQFDREGYDAYQARIEEGLSLFAKHYSSLWW